MATRKTAPKKKRSPKKRKPKVKLDNKKVMALAGVMIFICAKILSLTFMISAPDEKVVAVKEKNAAEQHLDKPAEKQKQQSVKKQTEKNQQQKNQPEKKQKKNETENKKTVSQKNQTEKKEVQKKSSVQENEKTPAEKTETEKTAEIKPKTAEKKETKAEKSEQRASVKNAKVQPEKEVKVQQKPQAKPETKPAPAKAKFNIPQAKNNARLCFIIDDGGHKTTNLRKYTTLSFPITIAVLPKLQFSRECARIVVADKKELMLHQPMQAQNLKMNPGPGAILPDMDLKEVYATISQNLAELGPQVKGFNNHEGSLITTDLNMMGAVLDVAADNKIYFVDSRTSKDSMATFAALERDMKILEREVFIDDVISRSEMLKQILRGIDIANKKGKVIMIGHVDKSAKILPQLFSELYPELKAKGYRLVYPSQLL